MPSSTTSGSPRRSQRARPSSTSARPTPLELRLLGDGEWRQAQHLAGLVADEVDVAEQDVPDDGAVDLGDDGQLGDKAV